MSTQPGPGYQQAPLEPGSEGDAPPPAFNPDAVNPNDYAQPQQPQLPSAPSAPSYGAIPPQPIQPQPIRQQIVQPPLYNPQQQPVQYVNQYGQPIHQQQVSPVVVVPPQQQVHQQTIIYAQPQNQNQALIQPYKPVYDYRMPSDKDRNKRYIAAMLGLLAMILLVCACIYYILSICTIVYTVKYCNFLNTKIIAMSSHTLASGSSNGYDIDCKILFLETNDYSQTYFVNRDAYYSDFCWNWDSDVSWDNWGNTDSEDWCDTWRGSSYWISCIVFGCLFTCLGTAWVQPITTMSRCCCPITCPRVLFFFGLLLSILGNVLWVTNDNVCLPSDALDLNVGVSVDLVAGSCAILFLTMFCAK